MKSAIKRLLLVMAAVCALAIGARADLVRLVSGKEYQGAVTAWGMEELSFVLQGGSASDAFTIPVRLVESVTLPDSTVHKPGTDSWIASGRLGRLPWERQPAAAAAPAPGPSGPSDRLSLKNWTVRLGLTSAMQSGYTTYQITFPWDPYVGNSRLDFPTDGFCAGIRASALSRPAKAGQLQYGVDLDFAMRMSDPRKDMTDSDWVSMTASGSMANDRLVFSATTSSAKASSWDLTAAARLMYPMATSLQVGGLLGYHYLHQYFEIYGVTGWQDTTWLGDRVYFDEFRNQQVGQYTVSYKMPMLGLTLLSETAEGLSVEARGAYLFSVGASDEDLHLLRNKKSVCSASGSGWQLDGEAWLRVKTFANKSTLSLGGTYSYLKVNTQGTQTQTYYADDPYYAGDQTGQSETGISDKLFCYRHTYGIFVTYTF